MTKLSKIYKLFMYTMVVAAIGMLIAMGVIAVQKSMRLNASIECLPGIDVEVSAKDSTGTETLLFRNFEDANAGKTIEFETDYCSISSNSLIMNDAFVTAYGNSFSIVIYNYSNFAVDVNISTTTTVKNNPSATAIEPTVSPAVSRIAIGGSQEITFTCNPVMSQEITLNIRLTEYIAPPYTLYNYNTTNVTTNYNAAWEGYSYIEMGEYPQSLKANEVTVTATTGTEGTTGAIGEGSDGAKYYYQQDVNGYGTSGWYKYEPLRWIVIGTSSDLTDIPTYGTGASKHTDITGEAQLLVISEFGLFKDYFDFNSPYTNQYGANDCDINVSLHNTFVKTAGLEKHLSSEGNNDYIAKVKPKTAYSNAGVAASDTISEYNLFLLGGVNSDTYYWNNYLEAENEQSQCIPTAFAMANGAYYDSDTEAGYWWLRSGETSSARNAYYFDYSGAVDNYFVDGISAAVRPSFILNI